MHHNLRYQQMNGLNEMLLSIFEKPAGNPKNNPESGQWLSVKEISDRLKLAFKGAYHKDGSLSLRTDISGCANGNMVKGLRNVRKGIFAYHYP